MSLRGRLVNLVKKLQVVRNVTVSYQTDVMVVIQDTFLNRQKLESLKHAVSVTWV
jgi:transcriptional regulator of met regulon